MAEQRISLTRTISAKPERIFNLLADPGRHALVDGSGTVLSARSGGPERLSLGSTFGMSMRLGLSYRITNTVVEFRENELIAWRHAGGHRWRWELRDNGDGTTDVTETFDWSTSRAPKALEFARIPQRNLRAIKASLRRLEAVMTA
ncbi:dimethyladenosine transferase [Actinoalloteichus sp. AHMU CJ021]|uniref:Conserved protein YndB, AHSA1/START domain n=2 Tax=Actinoalloteichus cyanogriseus TaxID=2893586 RepID=A0ABT1JGD1_ACTCY|nr:SRPBCC family protein [Actinoalloteichus caeruleus]AUS77639.1 dimethyladenosine transferase [Actinoalloteichus sp. AHMU CJ021]MCP2331537.1 putative conserved protein YndB, AHSA1/START domain [Actinoalloteichus caeruleus DSM 43889]